MAARPLTAFFSEIDKDDIPLVGGKGANLGEMANSGFPVPNGFAITVEAYDIFLEENKIIDNIYKLLKTVDHNDPNQLNHASKSIEKLILQGKIPDTVSKEITYFYKKLSGRFKKALVAVRSSATAEDLPEASFAGQQATFLNVKGEANLLEATRKCWASLFTARAIFYRVENKVPHEKVKISVIVQKMVQSEVSGVMFSLDPVTNEKDRIVIEAVWGLGEMIVQGLVVPDRYVVQKETFSILSKQVSDQTTQLIKVGQVTKEAEVPKKNRDKQKISDNEIVKLAKIADELQKHYYFPQDAEWAKEGKNLYLVQTRPVTTTKQKAAKLEAEETPKGLETALTSILTGTPASPGVASGPVKIVKSTKEIGRVRSGDVLIAPMTSPDFVPAMRKAVAIVTDQGGQTSHAAIVSRELGIPCVVGTKMATSTLKEDHIVTVDGEAGQIFLGARIKKTITERKEEKVKPTNAKTATKLYVNLAEPERAKEVAKLNVDGVGLLRAEFMIANIGIHPKEAIKTKKQDKFIDKLAHDMEIFCKAFEPRPVVYRATDFKTNEYRSLPGGKQWEPEEPNPMLGFRGAFRYIANPDVFNLELQAMKRVRERYKNLWLMIPFVRSPEELAAVRRVVAAEGFFESPTFKFWMMVELPINVILLEDFIKAGIDGVSIGSNDLTMLLLGTDRDNSEVARAFDERSPAVSWALKKVIKKCVKNRVSVSICGQAPSVYDDLVQELIEYGITSISVNPDAVDRVRDIILKVESDIIKNR
jgi:pyruvate,water dikinase